MELDTGGAGALGVSIAVELVLGQQEEAPAAACAEDLSAAPAVVLADEGREGLTAVAALLPLTVRHPLGEGGANGVEAAAQHRRTLHGHRRPRRRHR